MVSFPPGNSIQVTSMPWLWLDLPHCSQFCMKPHLMRQDQHRKKELHRSGQTYVQPKAHVMLFLEKNSGLSRTSCPAGVLCEEARQNCKLKIDWNRFAVKGWLIVAGLEHLATLCLLGQKARKDTIFIHIWLHMLCEDISELLGLLASLLSTSLFPALALAKTKRRTAFWFMSRNNTCPFSHTKA
jgi:hypothetical protein